MKPKAPMTLFSKFLPQFSETLTGFKWMGNLALDHEKEEGRGTVLIAFEESIGFMCGTKVQLQER